MSGTPTKWTVQVNDLVGGFVVTNYPHPLSEHDMRPDGDPAHRGYVIAECYDREDARTIAELLNLHTYMAAWPTPAPDSGSPSPARPDERT